MPSIKHQSRTFDRRAMLLLALSAASALGACSTTQLVTSWRDPAFSGPPLKKVMVMGISRQATARRVFENTFVASLGEVGVTAVASHVGLPQDGPPDHSAVAQAVREAGVDGVIVSRVIAREREVRRDMQINPVSRRSFYPGLGFVWVRVYEPQEIETVHLVAETTVYRVSDGQLIWSGITDSLEPTNWESATKGFARSTIAGLKQAGVF
jgi:hypothetical protein